MKPNPENWPPPEPSKQSLEFLETPSSLDAQVGKENLKSLEEQFAHPERIRIGEEEVDVYDISPEKRKTKTPIVLAPGFSATPMAHEQNIIELAKAARRVISVNSTHGLAEHGIEENLARDHAEVELAKLSAIIQTLDKLGIEQVDVVAHSEGGIYMALAALLYPGRIRNMVFVDPGGIIGKDNIFRLGKGMAKELKNQAASEARRTDEDRMKPGNPLGLLGILASNLKRTWGSIKAMTDADIIDMLKELKAQGVGISIIHGVDDKVFPIEKIRREIGMNTDAFVGFYSVRGGHNEIFTRPKLYTHAVDVTLDALEIRSNK